MVKRVHKIFLSLFITFFFSSILSAASLYKNIDSNEAYKLQQQGALLIDVRTKKEFQRLHAKGSVNIPIFEEKNGRREFNENFIAQIEYIAKDDYDKQIILICRSGARSAYAAEILGKSGFGSVYNVIKGFLMREGWLFYKLPTEK